jgi:hypothetical protein
MIKLNASAPPMIVTPGVRANNKIFLTVDKELREFLDSHPFVQDQFKQDPWRTIGLALQPGGQYFSTQ